MAAPKYPERTSIGIWDKEDKDGKETEHTRGAKLVTGEARITRMETRPGICSRSEEIVLVRVEVKLKWHSSSKYLIRCRRFLSSHRFALCQTLAASYLEAL